MRKILIAAAASAFLFGGASAASAYEIHFQTTSTTGTFSNGLTTEADDTTAAFSFDASFTTLSDVTISNGVFTDANTDLTGVLERATGLGVLDTDLAASAQINLQSPDNAVLDLTVFTLVPTVTGSYVFGGPEGEQAIGSFVGKVTFVPLPGSAPMLGGALIALAAVGVGLRRRPAPAT